jgi:hypothetical protein
VRCRLDASGSPARGRFETSVRMLAISLALSVIAGAVLVGFYIYPLLTA